MGYRVGAGLVAAAALAILCGRAAAAVAGVAVLVCLVDAAALRFLYYRSRVNLRLPQYYAMVDAVALELLNLWAARHVPGSLDAPFRFVLWNQVQGALAMWFSLYGVWAAVGGVLTSALLVKAMIDVNGHVALDAILPTALNQMSWIMLAFIGMLAGKLVLERRGWAALDEGVETGQELQRLRHLREVHDTVLQTLEGIALYASVQHVDERARLEGVAEAARAEARRLREQLRAVDEEPDHPLEAQLAACVEQFRGRGPVVELEVLPGDQRSTLPGEVRDAVRDATFEALTNVVKHADAGHVRVRLVDDVDGVEVLVEDDGRGFDPARTPGSFGLHQSIRSRVREIGGSAEVTSSPGAGTRVRLRIGGTAGTGARMVTQGRRSTADELVPGRHRR